VRRSPPMTLGSIAERARPAIEGRGDGLLGLTSSTELRIRPFWVRLTPFDLIIP
jgi:hypothetical protein